MLDEKLASKRLKELEDVKSRPYLQVKFGLNWDCRCML